MTALYLHVVRQTAMGAERDWKGRGQVGGTAGGRQVVDSADSNVSPGSENFFISKTTQRTEDEVGAVGAVWRGWGLANTLSRSRPGVLISLHKSAGGAQGGRQTSVGHRELSDSSSHHSTRYALCLCYNHTIRKNTVILPRGGKCYRLYGHQKHSRAFL